MVAKAGVSRFYYCQGCEDCGRMDRRSWQNATTTDWFSGMVLPGSKRYSGKFKRLAQLWATRMACPRSRAAVGFMLSSYQTNGCMHDPTTIACQLLRAA